jgi:ribonuclease HI
MGKFYAVVAGHTPGIYTDWPTTQAQVNGYKGVVYKSFATRTEAEDFIKSSTEKKAPTGTYTTIYTDGSYVANTCGFGVVILPTTGDKLTAYGSVPKESYVTPTNNVAELYAIYIGLSLVEGDVHIMADTTYGRTVLTSYIHVWMKQGWEGVANKELIQAIYSKMQGRSVTIEHVKAHAGHTYNEEADRLAEHGRTCVETLVVMRQGVRIM